MDWTEEDTEALALSNRIRQVICKADLKAYEALMDPEKTAVQRIHTKVGMFELWLTWQGTVFVISREGSPVRSAEIFRCGPPQAKSRPDVRWNKRLVREKLIPALDAEMVLDDLSLL